MTEVDIEKMDLHFWGKKSQKFAPQGRCLFKKYIIEL